MSDLVLKNVRVEAKTGKSDVVVRNGVIAEITPTGTATFPGQVKVLNGAGKTLLPGFVETHLHLDKALLDERMPNLAGTLEGAIKVTGALKAKFTTEDVLERARRVVDMAIANGTTLIRSHPDVDPIAKTIGAKAMLILKEEYKGSIDIQVVAFPQEGILKAPGTYEMMEECLKDGADVVGGCTYIEPTVDECKEHVNKVFDLAEKYSVPVDMHTDFQVDDSDPRYALVEYIAEVTISRGMQGRVTLGHMTSLGALHGTHRIEVWDKIKRAGINIIVLPFTDMHLNARGDDYNVRRGVAPVKLMWDVGISVGMSSNNVRNAFTPFGNADLMDVALFLAQVGHMGSPDDFAHLIQTITYQNARITGVSEGYGVEVGDRADLVLLDAPDSTQGLLDRAVRSAVIKGGKVVAETTKTTVLSKR